MRKKQVQFIAGYRIYVGQAPGNYTQSDNVGNVTVHTLGSLPTGTYYIAITAYDVNLNEGVFSGEIEVVLN